MGERSTANSNAVTTYQHIAPKPPGHDQQVERERQLSQDHILGFPQRLEQGMSELNQGILRLENRLGGMQQHMSGVQVQIGNIQEQLEAMQKSNLNRYSAKNRRSVRLTFDNAQRRDRNNHARNYNSHATVPEARLEALVNVRTGAAIPNFPATVAGTAALTSQQFTTMLEALQENAKGDLCQKRRRFRLAIGIVSMAID